ECNRAGSVADGAAGPSCEVVVRLRMVAQPDVPGEGVDSAAIDSGDVVVDDTVAQADGSAAGKDASALAPREVDAGGTVLQSDVSIGVDAGAVTGSVVVGRAVGQ